MGLFKHFIYQCAKEFRSFSDWVQHRWLHYPRKYIHMSHQLRVLLFTSHIQFCTHLQLILQLMILLFTHTVYSSALICSWFFNWLYILLFTHTVYSSALVCNWFFNWWFFSLHIQSTVLHLSAADSSTVDSSCLLMTFLLLNFNCWLFPPDAAS